jgi:UDP-2,4-diacetamido-2,4,6-trideoxy-beta-L-altropyranose hydrolase
MQIVIRVDGGADIGYGHLIRSGALAEELLARDHTVTVATTTPEPATAVLSERIELVTLRSRSDPDPFIRWLETASPDVVFTDAYPVDTAYQRAVRDRVPVAVWQDDSRYAVCADLFVNGNLYAADLDHEFVGHPPQTCLGPDYVLLREEIRARAEEEVPWRETPKRAIVTMGGGDVAGLTPTAVRAFDGFDLRVDAIVGPGCSETQEREIHAAASDCSADVRVNRDPEDLVERMARADFAVSTASTTTYELLAVGTPIVSIPVVDNQRLIADALRKRDLATVLQRDSGREAFRSAIEGYVTDAERRRRRQRQGRRLVDGEGSTRVCAEVLSIADEHPRT